MKIEEWLVIGGLAVVGYLFWNRANPSTVAVPVATTSNLGQQLGSLGNAVGTGITIATGLSEDISSLVNGNTYGS
jgi:hypothetical protein